MCPARAKLEMPVQSPKGKIEVILSKARVLQGGVMVESHLLVGMWGTPDVTWRDQNLNMHLVRSSNMPASWCSVPSLS